MKLFKCLNKMLRHNKAFITKELRKEIMTRSKFLKTTEVMKTGEVISFKETFVVTSYEKL